MSDPSPISCVSSSQAVNVNNDEEENSLNSLVTKINSEVVSKDLENNFDNCMKQISGKSNVTSPNTIKKINVKLKDGIVNDLLITCKDVYDENDVYKQIKEITTVINSKGDNKCILDKELSSTLVEEKLCSSKCLCPRLNTLNGGLSDNIYDNINLKSFLGKTSKFCESEQIYSKHILKNVHKNINGQNEEVSNFEVSVDTTNISKQIKIAKNSIETLIFDSPTNDGIKDKVLSDIDSYKTECENRNASPKLNIPNIRDEQFKKINKSHSELITLNNSVSHVNRKETESFSNDITKDKIDSALQQVDLEENNINKFHSKKLVEKNTMDNKNECTVSSKTGAINKSCNGGNRSHNNELLSGSLEQKNFHDNLNKVDQNIIDNCINVSKNNYTISRNQLTSTSTVYSDDNAPCSSEKHIITTVTSHYSKDALQNQMCCEVGETTNCMDKSVDLKSNSECETSNLDLFCVICEKEVEHLYYHAAKFHSCYAFVPVKYMKSYQEQLQKRSPNICENYLHSLQGSKLFICKICGMLLQSIDSVRIHLNKHSKVYAVFYSSGDCSCYKLNVMNTVQYITCLLLKSNYECFLCHQLTSCQFGLYNHLKVFHFRNNSCEKCSMVLSGNNSVIFDHNINHSDSTNMKIESVSIDYYQTSWNVLNNSLNFIDGKKNHLNLKNKSSDVRSFKFPIIMKSQEECLDTNSIISPSIMMKNYINSKFIWERSLNHVSVYASVEFDIYIQLMQSKKLMSVKKKKPKDKKKSQSFITSLLLKQPYRVNKRTSGRLSTCRALPSVLQMPQRELSKTFSVDAANDGIVLNTNESEETINVVEISGEWSNTYTFICCSCGNSFNCLTDIMDHKWLEHPGVWCAHTMLKGQEDVPVMFTQQYMPHNSTSIIKEANLTEFYSDQYRVNIKCTKCKENILVSEFCSHAVECGELNKAVIKKKCRKTTRMQSHKGQRMSSRYASSVRNSYKNIEDDSKMSSAHPLSGSWNDSKPNVSAKILKKEMAALGQSIINYKNKNIQTRSKKIKKISMIKRKKFRMKLRRTVTKNKNKSIATQLSKVKKLKANSINSKSKLNGLNHNNKITETESLIKRTKTPKIYKKNIINLKQNNGHQSIKKIGSELNESVNSSKGINKWLNNVPNNRSKKISGKQLKKPKLKTISKRDFSDFEDELSECEIEKSNPTKERRLGLRTRQTKTKKTGYLLRKKLEVEFESSSVKESLDSNTKDMIIVQSDNKRVIPEMKIEKLINTDKKDTDAHKIVIKRGNTKINSAKESLNVSAKEIKIVKRRNLETTNKKKVLNTNEKHKCVNKKIKLDISWVKELANTKGKAKKCTNKHTPETSFVSELVNTNKEDNTVMQKHISETIILKELGNTKMEDNLISKKRNPEAITMEDLVNVDKKDSKAVKIDIQKMITKNETSNRYTKKSLNDKSKSISKVFTKNANPLKRKKVNMVENINSEEPFGFLYKKRKYNIEDDNDSDNVVCHKRRVNLKPSQFRSRKNISKNKKFKVSSFGKFLKCFKLKSQYLKTLSRSTKFSDLKKLYKLTKRKMRKAKKRKGKRTCLPANKNAILFNVNRNISLDINVESPVKCKRKKEEVAVEVIDSTNNKNSSYINEDMPNQKPPIYKRRPKNRNKKNKKKVKMQKFEKDTSTLNVDEIMVQGENMPFNDKLITNMDLSEEHMHISENKLTNIEQTHDSSESAVTFSTASNNCNINVLRKNNPVSERSAKNSTKENRICKKKKFSHKDSFREFPVDFLCKDCGLSFDSALSKEDHKLDCMNIAFEMSIMADEKLFECPHCQLTFAMEGTQKKHITSCRVSRSRKSNKFITKIVKSNLQSNNDHNIPLLCTEKNINSSLSTEEISSDLNSIAKRFKNYCLQHPTAPQVCSLLYSCSLSTTELRNCLCDSITVESSTIVQPKINVNSRNKNNFSLLKSLLDQPECSDFGDVLYKVMLSVKANSYLKMKNLTNPFITIEELPTLVIEASRSELLKSLSGIEEYLKEAEEFVSSVQKKEMLCSMKLAFEAGTGS